MVIGFFPSITAVAASVIPSPFWCSCSFRFSYRPAECR
jgi:hypothetical protein